MTLPEIRFAWDTYKSCRAFSILKDGEWTHTPLFNGVKPPLHIVGTAAKTQALNLVMEFPDFLEKYYNGNKPK